MKNFKYFFAILTAGMLVFAACTKEETKTVTVSKSVTDGQALISGTVKYLDLGQGTTPLVAPFATIKIATDTTLKAFNQYWMADSTGSFSVKGLGVGSYYIAAQYTDKNNIQYYTTGFTVTIKNSVDPVSLNFICK